MAEAQLDNLDKVALVLEALGPESAGEVLKRMDTDLVSKIVRAIATPPGVSLDTKIGVVEEFLRTVEAQDLLHQGGLSFARQVLEKAYGKEQADAILSSLRSSIKLRPFESLASAKSDELVSLLQAESPQTIALVLSYLPSAMASEVLSHLPSALQGDILRRISTMESIQPKVLRQVEAMISQRMATTNSVDFNAPRGIDVAVGILNGVPRAIEKFLLRILMDTDPELAEEIKKRMFLFEDIATLDDHVIQIIIRKVDKKDLALGMRTLNSENQAAFYRNMSEQIAEEIHTEMDESGPVTLKVVEAAQGRIVTMLRQMEENEEIELSRGGEEDALV